MQFSLRKEDGHGENVIVTGGSRLGDIRFEVALAQGHGMFILSNKGARELVDRLREWLDGDAVT